MAVEYEEIALSKLRLDPENPRHDPIDGEDEIIRHLCDEDKLYELAKHIALHEGLNPLIVPGVLKIKDKGSNASAAYQVVDANRRVAALKTLRDPQLAPASYRKRFEALAEAFRPPNKVRVAIFENEPQAMLWRNNLHSGAGNGEGPRTWRAEQTDRATGKNKHIEALQLADVGERFDLISPGDLQKKTTTVTRFATNPAFRTSLRINNSDKSDLTTLMHPDDFIACLRVFLEDVVQERFEDLSGKRGSRYKSDDIQQYAYGLAERAESQSRVIDSPMRLRDMKPKNQQDDESQPANDTTSEGSADANGSDSSTTPTNEDPSDSETNTGGSGTTSAKQKVDLDPSLASALAKLGNDKLRELYRSLCEINAKKHPFAAALLSWCLLETLSIALGRNDSGEFVAFFNQAEFKLLPKSGKILRKDINRVLQRLQAEGNATKHSVISASHNYAQLINDMATISGFVSEVIESVLAKK